MYNNYLSCNLFVQTLIRTSVRVNTHQTNSIGCQKARAIIIIIIQANKAPSIITPRKGHLSLETHPICIVLMPVDTSRPVKQYKSSSSKLPLSIKYNNTDLSKKKRHQSDNTLQAALELKVFHSSAPEQTTFCT